MQPCTLIRERNWFFLIRTPTDYSVSINETVPGCRSPRFNIAHKICIIVSEKSANHSNRMGNIKHFFNSQIYQGTNKFAIRITAICRLSTMLKPESRFHIKLSQFYSPAGQIINVVPLSRKFDWKLKRLLGIKLLLQVQVINYVTRKCRLWKLVSSSGQ